jgi:hypothetical protein
MYHINWNANADEELISPYSPKNGDSEVPQYFQKNGDLEVLALTNTDSDNVHVHKLETRGKKEAKIERCGNNSNLSRSSQNFMERMSTPGRFVYINMYIYVNVYTHIYIYMYKHTSSNVDFCPVKIFYIYMYIYTCIFKYIYIHIYIIIQRRFSDWDSVDLKPKKTKSLSLKKSFRFGQNKAEKTELKGAEYAYIECISADESDLSRSDGEGINVYISYIYLCIHVYV